MISCFLKRFPPTSAIGGQAGMTEKEMKRDTSYQLQAAH